MNNDQEADNLPQYDYDYDGRDDQPILRDRTTGEPYIYNPAGEKVWL